MFGLYRKEWKPYLFRGGPKDDEMENKPVSIEFNTKIGVDPDKKNADPAVSVLNVVENAQSQDEINKDAEMAVN